MYKPTAIKVALTVLKIGKPPPQAQYGCRTCGDGSAMKEAGLMFLFFDRAPVIAIGSARKTSIPSKGGN